MNTYYKDFEKQFQKVAYKYSYGQIFGDFLSMAVCSFHTQNIRTRLKQPNEENEKHYMDIVRRYKPEEVREIAKLLPILMGNQYDFGYSDMLGEFFQEHITHGHNGQFFTPEPVCDLMAMMNMDEGMSGKRILDCACGSGRILLAAAKITPDNFFYGADNDVNCARMSCLNFFLNGLRGEVAWMNSLTMEWYGGWRINQEGPGILTISKEESTIWCQAPGKPAAAPKVPEALPNKAQAKPITTQPVAAQLSLF